MGEYIVFVKCIERRWVTANDPIEAIQKTVAPRSDDVTDEMWEWDLGIERVHAYIDDEEMIVSIPRDKMADINRAIKNSFTIPNEFGKSWLDMKKSDLTELNKITLIELLDYELQNKIKNAITEANSDLTTIVSQEG